MLIGGSIILKTVMPFKQIIEEYTSFSRGFITKEKTQIYTWNIKDRTVALLANIIHYLLVGKWSSFVFLLASKSPWLLLMDKINSEFSSWGS